MNLYRATTAAASVLTVSLLTLGCQQESQSIQTTPEVQAKQLEQISGGIGFSVYHFYDGDKIEGTEIGALLVTNGAYNGTYADETEFWRWDADAMADWQDDLLADIAVEWVGTSATWDASLASDFEAAPDDVTWTVNRNFNLDTSPSIVTETAAAHMYQMEAAHWAAVKDENGDPLVNNDGYFVDENGDEILRDPSGPDQSSNWIHESSTITYYMKADFTSTVNPDPYPTMTWYVSWLDYVLWNLSHDDPSSSSSIYEVRLTDDSVMTGATLGFGYELETAELK